MSYPEAVTSLSPWPRKSKAIVRYRGARAARWCSKIRWSKRSPWAKTTVSGPEPDSS